MIKKEENVGKARERKRKNGKETIGWTFYFPQEADSIPIIGKSLVEEIEISNRLH